MSDQAKDLLKSKQEKDEHNQDMRNFVEGKDGTPDPNDGQDIADQATLRDEQNRMKDQENRRI